MVGRHKRSERAAVLERVDMVQDGCAGRRLGLESRDYKIKDRRDRVVGSLDRRPADGQC